MSNTVFIYALLCPDTDSVRYVGRTGKLKARYTTHLSTKQKDNKSKWIQSLLEVNKKPKLLVLDEVSVLEQVEAEQKWIDHYRLIGANLTNTADSKIGLKTPEATIVAMTIYLPDELVSWLKDQARLECRSMNQHICYLLNRAMQDTDKPRYTLNHSGLCHNGTHCYKSSEPSTKDFCNCQMYTYGELK